MIFLGNQLDLLIMKLKLTLLCPLVFVFLFSLYAENSVAVNGSDESEAEVEAEEKELPEYSEPPYSIDDRAVIQGYYIPLADDISLNFRILNNRMFVYWVDKDDLIVESQASSGNVRFLAGVRGRNYYAMEPLSGEAGLGSVGGPVLPPHNFTVILSLKKEGSEEFETYPTFRHTLTTSNVRETREFPDTVESEKPKDRVNGPGTNFYRGAPY